MTKTFPVADLPNDGACKGARQGFAKLHGSIGMAAEKALLARTICGWRSRCGGSAG